jgi:hypothetical protein
LFFLLSTKYARVVSFCQKFGEEEDLIQNFQIKIPDFWSCPASMINGGIVMGDSYTSVFKKIQRSSFCSFCVKIKNLFFSSFLKHLTFRKLFFFLNVYLERKNINVREWKMRKKWNFEVDTKSTFFFFGREKTVPDILLFRKSVALGKKGWHR